MESPDPKPRRPAVQFSVLNVLLAVAAAAGYYGAWASYLQQEPLREQVQQLQFRLDGMQVSDWTLPHAVVRPQSGRARWEWRIFVPEQVLAKAILEVDPLSPISHGELSTPLPSGFSTLKLFINRTDRDYRGATDWEYTFQVDDSRPITMNGTPPPWAKKNWQDYGTGSMGRLRKGNAPETTVRDPSSWSVGSPFELMRIVHEANEDDGVAALIHVRVETATY